MEPTVVKAEVQNDRGYVSMIGHMSDGSTVTLFRYYSDELSFDPRELVGKTRRACTNIHFEADQQYLRS